MAFLPLTSPSSLDPAHVPLLRTALALLEVHPDRALGVAVTTDPALARYFGEKKSTFSKYGCTGLYAWASLNQCVLSLGTAQ